MQRPAWIQRLIQSKQQPFPGTNWKCIAIKIVILLVYRDFPKVELSQGRVMNFKEDSLLICDQLLFGVMPSESCHVEELCVEEGHKDVASRTAVDVGSTVYPFSE